MSSEPLYKFGDPVWSKMRGFCAWPSRIGDPSESALKNNLSDKQKGSKPSYLVYFFGSNNWAWMPEDTIKPYGTDTEKMEKGSKSVQFKQGLQQIKDYIAQGGKDSLTLPNSGGAIQNNNNDNAASMDASPSVGGDSFSNDNSNLDGKYLKESVNRREPREIVYGHQLKAQIWLPIELDGATLAQPNWVST